MKVCMHYRIGDEPCSTCKYDALAERCEYYEKDAAAAWDKCEERRLQAVATQTRVKDLTQERDDYILKQRVWEGANAELRSAHLSDQRKVKALEAVLGMSEPWPTMDILAKLIDATDHLLSVHGCDTHGHELFRAAVTAGKARLADYSQSIKAVR